MLNIDFLNNDYSDSRTPAEKAREQIKAAILSRELKPGQRLIEQKLCEHYSLSRPPLREVINQLAADGYVELIPNRGAFVADIDNRMLDDILSMKNLLYPQAVRWALERITVDEMDILQEVYGFIEFYYPTGDIPKLERFARGFDAVIYNASKNAEIEHSLLKYDFIIEHTMKLTRYPINYPEIIRNEYKAIFDAFRTRNVAQGEEAAQIHAFRSMLRIRSGI